jgi:IclR family acetate operon transcriptional repressor
MRAFTTSTITDVTTMLRELETIRKQGFAVDNFERFEAGRGLAVPVMGEGDLPVAAMLALGRLDPARDEETIQQMQSLARGLTASPPVSFRKQRTRRTYAARTHQR